MSDAARSDALVLFGFTGDLARKKIFPALYAMARRDELVPRIVGVSGSTLSADEARERVRQSLEEEGGIDDPAAFDRLAGAVRYVGGHYEDAATFERLKQALEGARRPAHYLAVPPEMFEVVIAALGRTGLAKDARLIVEKPFGRDLASARRLDAAARKVFPEEAIFRIDHYLGKEAIMNLLYFRFANAILDPLWCAEHIASVQVTMAEEFGVGTRGRFYESVGALRDVVENHLFQVVALLAMEPPASTAFADLQAAKAALFKSMVPLAPDDLVRGQYAGYLDEDDVAAGSDVETYVALRMRIDSPRWRGVPFYLRAGKKLPKTTAEVVVQFKRPARALFADASAPGARPNWLRFQLQPYPSIALAARFKHVGKAFTGEQRELLACDELRGEEAPYDRLLGDAMAGDGSLFTRADAVEAAWAVVDPVLADRPRVVAYEPGSWGPAQADALVAPDGGWIAPEPVAACATPGSPS
ncbi:MAG: glucose-6-phosphate dehydrogenase [Burkholderiaceae bacterium]